ncbi:PfkB family carbohydrate kinase [Limobrevibacterium gyesilva]|uniref:Ribokinase n=1 Tax=Limobrevibacterium gyesilva TaxID=2991712 RepID=A0AA41YKT6_9PROT|nr:PfkB family carbohydrate kinase [Limobrevibacterium gyesilva]MCW3474052.1 PfkB family carbohydrate kinase [Limobrevibacterium gyesilva]
MSRVFVLGNASIDVTLPVPRLPAPGETLMASGIARAPGGKGLNQAVVAARAGVAVHFCAPLGREPETAMIRTALAAERFADLVLPDVGQPTDLSTLLVADDAENCIVSTGACAEALPVSVAEAFVVAMAPDDILLLQGNLSEAATRAAAARAAHVVVNTAPIRWPMRDVLRHATVAVANRSEAEQVTGRADPERAALDLCRGVSIVTLGGEGCVVAAAGSVVRHPAPRVQAVDTTGAGDTFCGMLAASLARGMTLAAAVAVAQQAAALAVSRRGCFTALPTRVELASLLGSS